MAVVLQLESVAVGFIVLTLGKAFEEVHLVCYVRDGIITAAAPPPCCLAIRSIRLQCRTRLKPFGIRRRKWLTFTGTGNSNYFAIFGTSFNGGSQAGTSTSAR
jgi:hypothetical protein